jgi:hypothetical protein
VLLLFYILNWLICIFVSVPVGLTYKKRVFVNVFNRIIVKFIVGCKLFVPAFTFIVGLNHILDS